LACKEARAVNRPEARSPYPGLRPFARDDAALFFGRERSIGEMGACQATARFLAVVGASGSGKSSLVHAGLLPALEQGRIAGVGRRWAVADLRPRGAPFGNLAAALLKAAAPREDDRAPAAVEALRATLEDGPEALAEWCGRSLPAGTSLLIVVDQFEELFRNREPGACARADAFIAQLLASAGGGPDDGRVYVVVAMRSEYLAAAADNPRLARAINDGLYVVPRMNRDEVREAIAGPAQRSGFAVEPALIERILDEFFAPDPIRPAGAGLAQSADRLPLLQHVLKRLWLLAAAGEGDGPIRLMLGDYEALGGLHGALSAQGREILEELLPEQREVAPAVFRALTEGASLADAERRPLPFGELVAVSAGSETAVREVVEAFRAPGRNFLQPRRPASLRADTMIELSHECLIRQWDELAFWAEQEVAAAGAWRRLVDAAERHARGEGPLLSGLGLASLADWHDAELPTAAWAKRYGGDFHRAITFLRKSRRAERRDERALWRVRAAAIAALLLALVVVPAGVYAWYAGRQAQTYADSAALSQAEAEAARASAAGALAAAEAERSRADEGQRRAEAAEAARGAERIHADKAAIAESVARASAETERRKAAEAAEREAAARALGESERQKALASAEVARNARAEARTARREAEAAKIEEQRAARRTELAQVAGRVAALQDRGSWEGAATLLVRTLTDLAGPAGNETTADWLIPPIRAAIFRQTAAEYGVAPAFLRYAGLESRAGAAGRFRIHVTSSLNGVRPRKDMRIQDAVTGAVVGAFALPDGVEPAALSGLVSSDGSRAAVSVGENLVALWARDRAEQFLLPVPTEKDVEIKVGQLAGAGPAGRFALLLTRNGAPGELMVSDVETEGVSFRMAAEEIAVATGEDLHALDILGLAGERLFLAANAPNGRIMSVDLASGAVAPIDAGGLVQDAQLTADGRLLLVLACEADCEEQRLSLIETGAARRLWTEPVPRAFAFVEDAARRIGDAAEGRYSTMLESGGQPLIFEFAADGAKPTRRDARVSAWIGERTFTGSGSLLTVEEGAPARDQLTAFAMPAIRHGLNAFVAPRAVAIHQDGAETKIAAVSYDGALRVYRRAPNGALEPDTSFAAVPVGGWECLAGMAFGGDGKSLLIRRADDAFRYVAAGQTPSTGWRRPGEIAANDRDVDLAPAPPRGRRVPCRGASGAARAEGDRAGRHGREDIRRTRRWGKSMVGAAGDVRAIAVPSIPYLGLVRRGVTAIAGDPERGRIAALSPGTLEVVSAVDERHEVIQLGGDPRAAAFLADGAIAIAYADRRVEWREPSDGGWPVVRETDAPVEAAELIAAGTWLGIRDPRGALAVMDGKGGLTAFGRLPANPSAVALLSGKDALSLEWDTDSASVVSLAVPPADENIPDALRLIAMRGGADPIAPTTEARPESAAESVGMGACDNALGRRLAWLEARLAGDAAASPPGAFDCGDLPDSWPALVAAAEGLASRRGSVAVAAEQELSALLRAAAAGDRVGLRLLGALLTRAAAERADLDQRELARDALRFGAAFPPTFLKALAAGGPIGADILEAAEARAAFDPTAMQTMGHWHERRIDDADALAQALFEFAAAERLYAESGRAADARLAGERRAALARILPDARVLAVWRKVHAWRPARKDFGATAEVAEPPADPVVRGGEDRTIVEKLARRFPASPLVDALRVEVRRAEVAALAASDPAAAADFLLGLGGSAATDAVWSPDFVAD
jgi:hypothetical protein